MSKTYAVALGPHVEMPPASHFTRLNGKVDLHDVWKIVGPSVARNVHSLPLWKVIAMAYLEGLQHGAAMSEGGEQA